MYFICVCVKIQEEIFLVSRALQIVRKERLIDK